MPLKIVHIFRGIGYSREEALKRLRHMENKEYNVSEKETQKSEKDVPGCTLRPGRQSLVRIEDNFKAASERIQYKPTHQANLLESLRLKPILRTNFYKWPSFIPNVNNTTHHRISNNYL